MGERTVLQIVKEKSSITKRSSLGVSPKKFHLQEAEQGPEIRAYLRVTPITFYFQNRSIWGFSRKINFFLVSKS